MNKHIKWPLLILAGASLGFFYARRSSSPNTADDGVPRSSETEREPATNSLQSAATPKKRILLRTTESIPTNPEHPKYDPGLLIRTQGGDAHELFELEPRAEEWARAFEEQVTTYTSNSLAELESDVPVDVECHTAICKVDIDLSELDQEEAELIKTFLTSVAPIGSFTQDGWAEDKAGHLQIHTMLSPELRTSDGLSEFITGFAAGEGVAADKESIIDKLTAHRRNQ